MYSTAAPTQLVAVLRAACIRLHSTQHTRRAEPCLHILSHHRPALCTARSTPARPHPACWSREHCALAAATILERPCLPCMLSGAARLEQQHVTCPQQLCSAGVLPARLAAPRGPPAVDRCAPDVNTCNTCQHMYKGVDKGTALHVHRLSYTLYPLKCDMALWHRCAATCTCTCHSSMHGRVYVHTYAHAWWASATACVQPMRTIANYVLKNVRY